MRAAAFLKEDVSPLIDVYGPTPDAHDAFLFEIP